MRQLWFVVALGGCATATTPNENPDAPAAIDAPRIDAPGMQIDAPTQCTMVTSNLLINPAFEMTTTGWMETRIGGEAIVRADGPVAAHTPTLKAWMGGVLGDIGAPASDALWQDVMIPTSTTMLVVTGMYDVRTAETGGTAFDTGSLAIVTTANAPIESVIALSNLTPKTTWTAIDHPVTATVAGMTIRLRLTSSNDFTAGSSFYFDSLGLMATFCGP
jgi:hypothetical protein